MRALPTRKCTVAPPEGSRDEVQDTKEGQELTNGGAQVQKRKAMSQAQRLQQEALRIALQNYIS
jgi:hypothetical protein